MTNFRPIESFRDYFLDVKPYHTKILEIVEQYNIQEDVLVKFDENISFDVGYKNDPVCRPVGYGLVWDDECGFSATDCCDLYDCIGGFGLVYDNSDMVAEYEIIDIDIASDSVIVAGNQTRDKRFQISTIPSPEAISIIGDITDYINDIKVLLVVPVKTSRIVENTINTIFIEGNFVQPLVDNKEIQIYNTFSSDNIYRVKTTTYDPTSNLTSIELLEPVSITEDITGANVEFKIASRNSGAYSINRYEFDGAVTTIFLDGYTPLRYTNTTEGSNHGSIQLKTGLVTGREISIEGTGTPNDNTYGVLKSEYDKNLDQTTVFLSGILYDWGQPNSIMDVTPTPTPSVPSPENGFIRMYGYLQNSGFDGNAECTAPKHSHAKVGISEILRIEIGT